MISHKIAVHQLIDVCTTRVVHDSCVYNVGSWRKFRIFAPEVEKTGWKILATVNRKLLSKTLLTLHKYTVNS